MKAMNCWEFKKCGRQPGGNKAAELGICTAAIEHRVDGLHHGTNAGRVCWFVTGTLCGGKVQGSYAVKLANCMSCDFYQVVSKEESANRVSYKDVTARLM